VLPVYLIAAVVTAEPVLLDRPQPTCLYGDKFREALRQPLIASWEHVEPRALWRRLMEERQVAFLIDRRVDPSTLLTLSLTGEPLQAGCERIAAAMGAALAVPDNVLYVGPAETVKWLRTTIERHEQALHDPQRKVPARRRLDLTARHTVHWQDLDSPREILQQIARRHRLTIANLDVVPHDLWASATLPQVTAAEAMTMVLIQFELEWEWEPGGEGIRIVPWREPPPITRRYKPRGRQTAAQLLADWQRTWPDLVASVEGSEVLATGRVEDHEALRATLSVGKPMPAATEPTPLRRRLITLRVENAPVQGILQELEKSGITVAYDAARFRAAGIDLNRPVTLDVQKATADEFLQKLFDGLGITFEIDERTLRLKVKE